MWIVNVANFLLNIAGMATWWVRPRYFTRVWGYDAVHTGLALIPCPILSGIVTTCGGGCRSATATTCWCGGAVVRWCLSAGNAAVWASADG